MNEHNQSNKRRSIIRGKAGSRNSLLFKLGFSSGEEDVTDEAVMKQLSRVVSDNPMKKTVDGSASKQKQRKSMKKGRRDSVGAQRRRGSAKKEPKAGFMDSLLRSFAPEAENTEVEASKDVEKKKKPKSKSIHEGLKLEASATASKVRKEDILNRRASHLSRIASIKVHNNNDVIQEVIPYLIKNRVLWKEFQAQVLEAEKTEKVNEAKMSLLLQTFVHKHHDDIMANHDNPRRQSMADHLYRKRNSIAEIITNIANNKDSLPSFIVLDDTHEDRSVISDLAQECFNPHNTVPTASFGADVL